MADNNARTKFYYASTLPTGTSGGYLITKLGTASGSAVRRVMITDVVVLGTAASVSVRFVGESGPESDLRFSVATSENLVVSFNTPIPLSAEGTTGVTRGIYGSVSEAGVRVIVSGYVDIF